MPREFTLDGVPFKETEQREQRQTDFPWMHVDEAPTQTAAAEPVVAASGAATISLSADEARRRFCLWLEEQVGYCEGANNYNKYADTPGLSEMYGWYPQNQPWCDIFYDSGMIDCFGLDAACAMTYQPKGAGSALCSQSAQYYIDNGAWYSTPEIGDQAFFYVNGAINHTGGVVYVDAGNVAIIEGNSSDMVAKRYYSVGDGKIAGYGRPKWSAAAGGTPDTPVTPQPPAQDDDPGQRTYCLKLPYLQRGDKGASVTAAQFELAAQGYNLGPDGADGDYGVMTESAVKEFQRTIGVQADGVIGPKTGARLFGGEIVEEAPAQKREAASEDASAAEDIKAASFWDGLLAKIKGK